MPNRDKKPQAMTNPPGRSAERAQPDVPNAGEGEAYSVQDLTEALQTHQAKLRQQNVELRHAHDEIEKARDRYWDLFDFAPVGYFVLDSRSIIKEINYTGAILLGVQKDAVLGTSMARFIAPRDADRFHAHVRDALEKGTRQTCRLEIVNHAGNATVAHLDSVAVGASRGSTGLCRTAMTNIARQHGAEWDRQRFQDELRRGQRLDAIGSLAAGVAHEFNNVVTAIIGYAETARNLLPSGHAAQRALRGIDGAASQASQVTRSLLTFSRRTGTTAAPVALARVIDDTVSMLRPMLPAAIDMKKDTPPDDALWVLGDDLQLQQILVNLAVNARDAMPDGGTLTIRAHHVGGEPGAIDSAAEKPPSDTLELQVEDTGVGMDETVRERVFEPFFSTKPGGEGAGMGMAVVYEIVTGYGGRIDVDSAPARGTRVTITLPTCAPPPPAPHAAPHDQTARASQGETLLLAEDDPHVRRVISAALRSTGYDVLEASDGDEVLRVFGAHRDQIQLLLVDPDLPKKNGLSCLREIRVDRPDLPAIVVTGDPGIRLADVGVSDVVLLRKPFGAADLVGLVGLVLEESRERP